MLINIDFSASNKDSLHSPFQYEVHPSRFVMRFQTTLSIVPRSWTKSTHTDLDGPHLHTQFCFINPTSVLP